MVATPLRLCASTAVLLLMAPASAWAQTAVANPVPSVAQDEPAELGEIVVTAQKRQERLIDVPQSITAVTGEDLQRQGATQLRDFATTVPALTFTTSGVGQSQITLRGVTAGVDIGPTVGVYVDDVPYGSSGAFVNAASLGLDAGLFDLDRIEVLRGPQGTLYGASSMGGVLKYVTRQPSLAGFEGAAQGGLSFTSHGGANYNGAAALSGPIVSDTLGVRASAYYSRDGGYIDNLALDDDNANASKVYGGRLDFLYEPTDKLKARLVGFAQNIRRDGMGTADYTLAGQPVDGDLDQRRLKPEPFDQNFRLISGSLAYDFGPATLTSISSYQTSDVRYVQDASALYVPLLGSLGLNFSATALDQHRTTDKFAQEVRLASSGGGMFEWLVGGFYTHESSTNGQQVRAYDTSGALSAINLGNAAIPSTYEEIAAFGNATVHFTDKFDVSGGLRYARNIQRFEQNATGLLVSSAPEAISSENVATYLLNTRYRFSSDETLYARFATGYRPGGPNFVARDPVSGALLAPQTFQSDTLESYEIGYKRQTADRRFGVDAAAYHIDWKDIQVQTGASGVAVIVNAGAAKIDGAELTLTARPVRSFTLTGAFAYQDARLAEDAPGLGAMKGDKLPNVPKFTAALSADYRASGEGLRPSAGATLRFVSDRVSSFDQNPGIPQFDLKDYVLVDLRAGVTIRDADVQLFARNLFDDRGRVSAITNLAVAGGPAQVAIVQPRTIGLSVTKHF
jgi:outer membrane receptor protein involved in Fe transport